MAPLEIAPEYNTYEGRLASFQTAQPLAKRRASTVSSKAPKAAKWPHKFLSPEEVMLHVRGLDSGSNAVPDGESWLLPLSYAEQP
jgi:hypothetical protein